MLNFVLGYLVGSMQSAPAQPAAEVDPVATAVVGLALVAVVLVGAPAMLRFLRAGL